MPVVVNYPPPSSVVVNDMTNEVVVSAAGPRGPQGQQGQQGIQGIQGIQGVPGEGVATGGAAKQVLTKQSATNFDTAWEYDFPYAAAVADGGSTFFGIPSHTLIVQSTVLLSGTRPNITYSPFFVRYPVTITDLGYDITALAAGVEDCTLEISIYDADTEWQPTGSRRLLSTVAHSATGQTIVTGLSVALPTGRYLTEVRQSSADRQATVRGYGVDVAGFAAYDFASSPQNAGRRVFRAGANSGQKWNGSTPTANIGMCTHFVLYKWSLT